MKDGFECEVIEALARLEEKLEPLIRDVREHRDRLGKVEKTQFRFGVIGGAVLMVLAAAGQSVSTMIRTALAALDRG
jgi:hypothetical protein